METKSLRAKTRNTPFARSISREKIIAGPAAGHVDPEQHISFAIHTMRDRTHDLRLAGTGLAMV